MGAVTRARRMPRAGGHGRPPRACAEQGLRSAMTPIEGAGRAFLRSFREHSGYCGSETIAKKMPMWAHAVVGPSRRLVGASLVRHAPSGYSSSSSSSSSSSCVSGRVLFPAVVPAPALTGTMSGRVFTFGRALNTTMVLPVARSSPAPRALSVRARPSRASSRPGARAPDG